MRFGFKRIKMAPKRAKVVKAKIDLTKGSRNAKMSSYISPMKSIVSSKKSENKLIKSSQKSKKSPIRDPATKRDIELMQQKIQQMACQTLMSRVEYCFENLQMRDAIQRVKRFSNQERKIEAVEYMFQIQQKRALLESLVQWVKVVYANELKPYRGSISS